MGPATGAGSRDNAAIKMNMRDVRAGNARHGHTTAETRVIGKEIHAHCVRDAVKHFDMRPAAGTSAGDNLRMTICKDIRYSDENAAREAFVVSVEFTNDVAAHAIPNSNERAAARASASNDVRHGIRIEIEGEDVNATAETC